MNLKELSKRLDLSQTTVSRALNGYPEVSEATRIRVQHAAKTWNYKPNARAKALATGRSWAIGHVIPVDLKNELVNPVFGEFVAGASEIYSANGYELVLKLADREAEEAVYRELKSKGAVDGVVVHAPRRGDERVGILNEIGLPFVVHGRMSDVRVPYSWIDVNNRSAFRRATKFLIDLGHRRIALVNGSEALDFAHFREVGYREALDQAGMVFDPDLVMNGDLTEAYGYRSAGKLLDCAERPSAMLVSSYIAAIGVRRAAIERGLEMARDLSVVIHDDELSYFYNSEDVPYFTATRSSVREAGRRAAEILIDVIEKPDQPPVTELLEAALNVGGSTGPFHA